MPDVLQCGAVCCSVLQRVAVCCSVLQRVAVCCSVLQHVADAVLADGYLHIPLLAISDACLRPSQSQLLACAPTAVQMPAHPPRDC